MDGLQECRHVGRLNTAYVADPPAFQRAHELLEIGPVGFDGIGREPPLYA